MWTNQVKKKDKSRLYQNVLKSDTFTDDPNTERRTVKEEKIISFRVSVKLHFNVLKKQQSILENAFLWNELQQEVEIKIKYMESTVKYQGESVVILGLKPNK